MFIGLFWTELTSDVFMLFSLPWKYKLNMKSNNKSQNNNTHDFNQLPSTAIN